jgi:hypothetical protein
LGISWKAPWEIDTLRGQYNRKRDPLQEEIAQMIFVFSIYKKVLTRQSKYDIITPVKCAGVAQWQSS